MIGAFEVATDSKNASNNLLRQGAPQGPVFKPANPKTGQQMGSNWAPLTLIGSYLTLPYLLHSIRTQLRSLHGITIRDLPVCTIPEMAGIYHTWYVRFECVQHAWTD
jgi:hypothetical protein